MNTDCEAIHNHEIFLDAVRRAKAEAEARKVGRVVPVNSDNVREEVAKLDARIRTLNDEIASAEASVNALKECKTGQMQEAGNVTLREGGNSETVRTLTAIANTRTQN
jgi:hypothetical protein